MYLNFLPGNTFSTVDQLVERQTSNPEVQGGPGFDPCLGKPKFVKKKFPRGGIFIYGYLEPLSLIY